MKVTPRTRRSGIITRHINCVLPPDAQCDTALAKALFLTLVAYILYDKSFIPMPFEQLQKTFESNRKETCPRNSNQRELTKMWKWIDQFIKISSSCDYNDYGDPPIKQACVILGPSATCGKQVFKVSFNSNGKSVAFPSSAASQNSNAMINRCKRLLIREMIQSSSELDTDVGGTVHQSNSMFLGFQFVENRDHNIAAETSGDVLEESAFLSNFTPRENFKCAVKGRRGETVHLSFQISNSDGEGISATSSHLDMDNTTSSFSETTGIDMTASCDKQEKELWFILRKAIKKL